jgi:hypothetical protein
MLRRMFWLTAGVTIGVVAVRKVAQARSTLGPEGLNRAVGHLGDSIGEFADALRSSMAERENDLRTALGVQVPEAPEQASVPSPVTAESRRSLR